MTSRTRTFLVLAALAGALALPGASAQAAFEPTFDVAGPGGYSYPSVARDSAGATHFGWAAGTGALLARTRTAGGSLGPTLTVAPSGSELKLSAGAAGAVEFIWRSWDGSNWIVRARRLLPDGTLEPAVDLSSAGFGAHDTELAADAAGRTTFAWIRALGADRIAQARRRAPNGTLGSVENISPAGDVSSLQLAVNDAGDAAFAWIRLVGGSYVAEGRRWAAGDTLGPVVPLTSAGATSQGPRVGVDAAGNAYFSVVRGEELLVRRLGADGVLGPAKDVRGQASDHVFEPDMAVDADGDVELIWAMHGEVHARRRFADGSLGPLQVLDDDYGQVPIPNHDVAFDAQGNAHLVWLAEWLPDPELSGRIVVMARSVAADGSLREVEQVSAGGGTGYAGKAYHLSIAPGGDGRPVAVWTRSVENDERVVQGGVVADDPAGTGPSGSTGGTGGGTSTGSGSTGDDPDLTAPALTRLALVPRSLIAGRRGRVEYTLSETAAVVLRVARRGAGRRAGGRCVKATLANRSRKRCDLLLRGSFGEPGQAGQNRLAFRGALRGRRLRPGRYALVGVARDAAGNRSTPVRAGFRITRPAS